MVVVEVDEFASDLVDSGEASDGFLGDRAGAGASELVEFAPGVRGRRGAATVWMHALVEDGVVSAVSVGEKRPRPSSLAEPLVSGQECHWILSSAPEAEVVDHARHSVVSTSRISPDVGPTRLARARVEQRHRCFVGVQHPAIEHEALVRLVQRLQRRAGLARPRSQRGARGVYAAPSVDALLPVVRDVVGEAAKRLMSVCASRPLAARPPSMTSGTAASCLRLWQQRHAHLP